MVGWKLSPDRNDIKGGKRSGREQEADHSDNERGAPRQWPEGSTPPVLVFLGNPCELEFELIQ
jgi:hypothetical protein